MIQPATEYSTELESKVRFYLSRLRKIDAILEGPVRTLVSIANDGLPTRAGSHSPTHGPVYFPTWISETVQPERIDHLLTQALCSGTLQRLWRLRRRFPWLEKHLQRLEGIQESMVKSFTPPNSAELNFDECINRLKSQTFGCLNPLTASQVFRVFLDAGENYAHAPMGFLAFFAMVWPLYRRFPDPLNIGAAIEPWEPTAYVTANCLVPIKTLQSICRRRAQLLERISQSLKILKKLARENDHRQRWLFNWELDELSANLTRLSELAIVKQEFLDCSNFVGKRSDETTINSDNEQTYHDILEKLEKTLRSVGQKSLRVLESAESMLDAIEREIVRRLVDLRSEEKTPGARKNDDYRYLTEKWEFRFAQEYLDDPDGRSKYWNDLKGAAQQALTLCRNAEDKLRIGADYCREVGKKKSIDEALTKLAAINHEVADFFDSPVEYAKRWCRSVVDREIAHASAKNLTDFDPAELVSAIAVAVRWELMTTSLQVSDAITKALDGALPDGSWRSGQPFFSPNHVTGIWPVTSDIVWTLVSAIEQHPDVDVADDVLFKYVDWLERTKTKLRLEPSRAMGWASERLRHRRKIHLATTAYSINALLEIRDLIEFRLWQLCEQRFSVVRNVKGLKAIDPVDLGAMHHSRLHSHLGRMARNAQDARARSAIYSLILHGPPGSSKTSVAEAISAEMWKGHSRWGAKEPRLLRITPADFTRMGEDRLDSEARVIFELLRHVRATTILFDEIDDLLRQRTTDDSYPRFMELVVPAMLNRLADLRSACPRQEICFLLGTNYIERIEPALIRKGRIDLCVPVVYPDRDSRLSMVGRHIENLREAQKGSKIAKEARSLKAITDILAKFHPKLARDTSQWPWQTIESTLTSLTRDLEEYFKELKVSSPINPAEYRQYVETALDENGSSFTRLTYSSRWPKRFSQELFNEYLFHMASSCGNRKRYEEEITKELPAVLHSATVTKAEEERLLKDASRVWDRRLGKRSSRNRSTRATSA